MNDGAASALLIQLAIGMARVGPALILLPFLNDTLIKSMTLRLSVTALIALGLLPVYALEPDAVRELPIWLMVGREALVGFVIGFSLAAPFWAAQVIGELIDNQRGATISSTIDPTVGVTAAPLASFLNFFWTTAFLIGGGLLTLLETLAASYRLMPPGAAPVLDSALGLGAARLVGAVVFKGVVLAGPPVAAMLLCEILLGVLSRFAPQLNAFAVALGVKSIVAVLILLGYLMMLAPGELMRFMQASDIIHHLVR